MAALPDPDANILLFVLVVAAPNGDVLLVLPAAANGEVVVAAANGDAVGLLEPRFENKEAADLSPVFGAPKDVLD